MRFFAPFRLLVPLLSFLLSAAYAQTAPLAAASAHYGVYQGDKAVGSGDYNIQPGPNGYTLTSHGQLKLSKFNYSFANTQRLDGDLNLVRDELDGNVNGSAVTFTANADPTGRGFQMNVSANGKQTQNTVDRHLHLVLLPDLDPAAYILLARLAIQNPPTSWILIPKQDGILVPSSITHGSSVRGQLNGTQIDVQHSTVTVGAENTINVELFYTPDSRLLEADLPQQNFSVVQDGFKLIDHPKPTPSSNGSQGRSTSQYPAPQGGAPEPVQQ
ncbi:MAG TPA: hypothetical protein VHT28_01005 [Silvibacterium sp.]|jgi:hypothetical protein|nr:hypothetical protein [Silvibacterium sp.]